MEKRDEKGDKIDRVTLNQIREGTFKSFDNLERKYWRLHLGLYEKQLSIFLWYF